jgi:hypothetical protein
VVIVGIDSSRKSLDTIEGNTLYQEIRAGSRSVRIVTALYKVVGDTKYPAGLFEPTVALAGTAIATLEGTWKVTVGANTWFYKFARNHTVDWGRSAGGKDGSGQWFVGGKTFLKMAWSSGSVELWDVTTGLSTTGQKGALFSGSSAPLAVSADKT